MIDFATVITQRVKLLLSKLDASNVEATTAEVFQAADLFGAEGQFLLLALLIERAELGSSAGGDALKQQPRPAHLTLLASVSQRLAGQRPGGEFAERFVHSLTETVVAPTPGLLSDLSEALALPFAAQLYLSLTLAQYTTGVWQEEGERFLVDRIAALRQKDTGDEGEVPPGLLHRTLACVQSADVGERVRRESGGLQRKVVADLDASNRQLPVTLLPLLGDVSIDKPGALREFIMGDHNKGGDILTRLASSSGPSMVIEELGYGCATTKEYFKEVVGLMPAMDERELARLVGVLARTHSSLDVPSSAKTLQSLAAAVGINPPSPASMAAATWNYDNAVDALREMFPNLNWASAMSHLDHDGFAVPDARAFEAVVRMFSRATKDKEPFPVSAVCTGSAWSRAPNGQLEFLRHAVVAAPEMFPWAFSRRKIVPVEGLAGGASPIGTPNHCWLSVDLYLTLAALAGGGGELAGKVRGVLEPAMQACAEVVALGASAAMVEDMTAGNGLLVEVTTAVLPPYLSATGHPNAALVLHRVWASGVAGQECVARAMAEMHAREGGANVPRLLDVCQDLKALSQVLDRAPHAFAVELAALAARREYLNLEKWLQERAAASGAPFAAACLRFLRARAMAGCCRLN